MIIKTTTEIWREYRDNTERTPQDTNKRWVSLEELEKLIIEFRDGFIIPKEEGTPFHWKRIDTLNMLLRELHSQEYPRNEKLDSQGSDKENQSRQLNSNPSRDTQKNIQKSILIKKGGLNDCS